MLCSGGNVLQVDVIVCAVLWSRWALGITRACRDMRFG